MVQRFGPFWVRAIDEDAGGGSLVSEVVSDVADSSVVEDSSEDVSDRDSVSESDSGLGSSASEAESAEEEKAGEHGRDAHGNLEPEAQATTTEATEQWSMNPRQQAYYEAQMLGRDSEWAENRAFDIYEERQAITNMRANASVHVPVLAQQFERSGLPAEAAGPYYENLLKLTKQGFRNAAQDPQAQRVALANALGEFVIREHMAGRNSLAPKDEPKRMVTPTTGSSHGSHFNISRLSRADQRFINQWQGAHNGGKPPTSKQLAAMEAEGLIG